MECRFPSVQAMNAFRIKRKKDIDHPRIIRTVSCFLLILGALLIICATTGAQLFTLKHVLIFSLCSIPLCVLYAYCIEKLGSGLGGMLSGAMPGKLGLREKLGADLERARYSKRENRFEEALRIIDRVLVKDPDFPEALFLKGQIMWEGFKNPTEAADCFKKVMGVAEKTDTLHRWASSYHDQIKKGGK
jgi:tetratricopeptide (TPR) repeat protein